MQQKPALILLALAIVGAAVWFFTKPNPVGTTLRIREIAARGLAEELVRAELVPSQPSGTRVLVLSNPFTQRANIAKSISDMEQAALTGVWEVLGGGISGGAVAFPELKPEAQQNPAALLTGIETTTPVSFLVTPDAFDKVIKQHADCVVVVSLIGLPGELEACEAWKPASPVKFALLLPDFRSITDSATVVQAVKSGKLVAFVLAKPGAPDNNVPASGDWKEEFERRFQLVTAANVEQVLQSMPNLF